MDKQKDKLADANGGDEWSNEVSGPDWRKPFVRGPVDYPTESDDDDMSTTKKEAHFARVVTAVTIPWFEKDI